MISLSDFLAKARKGDRKAGAKYTKRTPKAGGGYNYSYQREIALAHAAGTYSADMDARLKALDEAAAKKELAEAEERRQNDTERYARSAERKNKRSAKKMPLFSQAGILDQVIPIATANSQKDLIAGGWAETKGRLARLGAIHAAQAEAFRSIVGEADPKGQPERDAFMARNQHGPTFAVDYWHNKARALGLHELIKEIEEEIRDPREKKVDPTDEPTFGDPKAVKRYQTLGQGRSIGRVPRPRTKKSLTATDVLEKARKVHKYTSRKKNAKGEWEYDYSGTTTKASHVRAGIVRDAAHHMADWNHKAWLHAQGTPHPDAIDPELGVIAYEPTDAHHAIESVLHEFHSAESRRLVSDYYGKLSDRGRGTLIKEVEKEAAKNLRYLQSAPPRARKSLLAVLRPVAPDRETLQKALGWHKYKRKVMDDRGNWQYIYDEPKLRDPRHKLDLEDHNISHEVEQLLPTQNYTSVEGEWLSVPKAERDGARAAGLNYIYHSPMRPLAGATVRGAGIEGQPVGRFLFTKHPIDLDQLHSLELRPFGADEAGEAMIEYQEQKFGDQPIVLMRATPKRRKNQTPEEYKKELARHKDARRGAIVHLNTRSDHEKYPYQLTRFDSDGYSGHDTGADLAEMVGRAMQDGYTIPDPDTYNEIAESDRFNDGIARVEQAHKEWEKERKEWHAKRQAERAITLRERAPDPVTTMHGIGVDAAGHPVFRDDEEAEASRYLDLMPHVQHAIHAAETTTDRKEQERQWEIAEDLGNFWDEVNTAAKKVGVENYDKASKHQIAHLVAVSRHKTEQLMAGHDRSMAKLKDRRQAEADAAGTTRALGTYAKHADDTYDKLARLQASDEGVKLSDDQYHAMEGQLKAANELGRYARGQGRDSHMPHDEATFRSRLGKRIAQLDRDIGEADDDHEIQVKTAQRIALGHALADFNTGGKPRAWSLGEKRPAAKAEPVIPKEPTVVGSKATATFGSAPQGKKKKQAPAADPEQSMMFSRRHAMTVADVLRKAGGHKYLNRHKNPKGGWVYEYANRVSAMHYPDGALTPLTKDRLQGMLDDAVEDLDHLYSHERDAYSSEMRKIYGWTADALKHTKGLTMKKLRGHVETDLARAERHAASYDGSGGREYGESLKQGAAVYRKILMALDEQGAEAADKTLRHYVAPQRRHQAFQLEQAKARWPADKLPAMMTGWSDARLREEWHAAAGTDNTDAAFAMMDEMSRRASMPKPVEPDPAALAGPLAQTRMEFSRRNSPTSDFLRKARQGDQKAGHKYTSRHKNSKGEWEYVYASGIGGATGHTAGAHQLDLFGEEHASAQGGDHGDLPEPSKITKPLKAEPETYKHGYMEYSGKEIDQMVGLIEHLAGGPTVAIDRRKFTEPVLRYALSRGLLNTQQWRSGQPREPWAGFGPLPTGKLYPGELPANFVAEDLPVEATWRLFDKHILKGRQKAGKGIASDPGWLAMDIYPEGDRNDNDSARKERERMILRLARHGYFIFQSSGEIWDLQVDKRTRERHGITTKSAGGSVADVLSKARKGESAAGHKYESRTWSNDGWVYHYPEKHKGKRDRLTADHIFQTMSQNPRAKLGDMYHYASVGYQEAHPDFKTHLHRLDATVDAVSWAVGTGRMSSEIADHLQTVKGKELAKVIADVGQHIEVGADAPAALRAHFGTDDQSMAALREKTKEIKRGDAVWSRKQQAERARYERSEARAAAGKVAKPKPSGSYAELGGLPKIGQSVWYMGGPSNDLRPMKAKVLEVLPEEGRDAYVGLLGDDGKDYASVRRVFGHKPTHTGDLDDFGRKVWK